MYVAAIAELAACITEAIFYIPKKKIALVIFFFRGGFLSFRGESPFAPVYFEGCYLLVFLMNTITSAHTKKKSPDPRCHT